MAETIVQSGQSKSRENPKFGRKVFFLDPPLSLSRTVIEMLKAEEYEIYIIPSYEITKSVLRENKDAMLFINIDSKLTFRQWFNFIFSFQDDPILRTILVGVVSERATASDQTLFLENLQLACGFQILNAANSIIFGKLMKIFELNGAKGNRKYIRLDCKNMKVVSAYFIKNSKLYELSINDISSVGFAATFTPDAAGFFKEAAVFNDISFNFGRKTIVCPSVVLRVVDNLAVFLFTNAMPLAYKNAIRSYVQMVLSRIFEAKIKNAIKDFDEYEDEVDLGSVIAANNSRKVEFDGDSDFGNLEDVNEI